MVFKWFRLISNIFGFWILTELIPDDDPVVFHRGPVVWDMNSFTPDNKLTGQDQPPIPVDTILTIDQFTGKVIFKHYKSLLILGKL